MALDSLPDLQLGSDALMEFLTSGLQQLEQVSGEADAEARGLLQKLQQQTMLMQTMSGNATGAQAMTELEIAHQIDSLDAQLSQLETSLSAADASTMRLLGQSTSKWLNSETADQISAPPLEQQIWSPTAQEGTTSTVADVSGVPHDIIQSSSSIQDTTEVKSSSEHCKAAIAGSRDNDSSHDGRHSGTAAEWQLEADSCKGVNSTSSAPQESTGADRQSAGAFVSFSQ